jgi:hypothetical protein
MRQSISVSYKLLTYFVSLGVFDECLLLTNWFVQEDRK